jgi:hypothetical protein
MISPLNKQFSRLSTRTKSKRRKDDTQEKKANKNLFGKILHVDLKASPSTLQQLPKGLHASRPFSVFCKAAIVVKPMSRLRPRPIPPRSFGGDMVLNWYLYI